MRLRILQALALAGTLYALGPIAEPAQIGLDELDLHYGETVRLAGRVSDVAASGDVTRVTLTDGDHEARVLMRGSVPPLGTRIELTGQPSPERSGAIVWANEGFEQIASRDRAREPMALAEAIGEAPTLAPATVAVAGPYDAEQAALTGSAGRLPVTLYGIDPPEDTIVLWGRLVYQSENARYALEATGWEPWPIRS